MLGRLLERLVVLLVLILVGILTKKLFHGYKANEKGIIMLLKSQEDVGKIIGEPSSVTSANSSRKTK